jgi:hypothetical protein
VYDNMADEWAAGFAERKTFLPVRLAGREPSVLIVVNSSARGEWNRFRLSPVRLLDEFRALSRDESILYANTTAPRRRSLIARFDLAETSESGLHGAYVGIEQSPYRVAQQWQTATGPWAARAPRAAAVIQALNGSSANAEQAWSETAKEDRAIGTQLSRMKPAIVARLVHHAYVTAMCNLHVILGYPLLPIPPLSRFLAATTSTDSPSA